MRNLGIAVGVLISVIYLSVPLPSVYAYKAGNVDVYATGSVSETFDDNIAQANDDEMDDFITNVGVGILAAYEGKATTFELAFDVIQHLFSQYDDFSYASEYFSVNVTHDISEYDHFTVTEAFIHSQYPIDFAAEFGRIPGRYDYVSNDFSLGYSHDFTSQFAMNARYANKAYVPSRSVSSDSYLNQFGIGGDYSLSSATTLLFDYDYFQRNFHPGEDSFFNVLSAGLRQYFTKQFYLESKIGPQFISSFNGEDYIKPMIIASLVDDISKNTRWSLIYKKEHSTDPYTQDLFNYWSALSQIAKQLTERSEVTFSGFYGEGKYPGLEEKVDLMGLNLGFGYSINENIKGTISYAYTQTDSNDPEREYLRNKFDLGINVKF